MDNFPWEALKADCLRLVCQQICASHPASFGKRDDMIRFLRDVNARGLDDALTTLGELTTSTKRKNSEEDAQDDDVQDDQDYDEEEEDGGPVDHAQPNSQQAYNTRFKGVKRVKMGRDLPEGFPYTPPPKRGRPRKNPLPFPSTATDENGGAGPVVPQKRPRGRPRKHPLPPVVAAPNSEGTKQVFDGVVVTKRTHAKRGSIDSAAGHDPDADAEGDLDGEVEEAPVPQHQPQPQPLPLPLPFPLPEDLVGMNAVVGQNDSSDSRVSNQADSSLSVL